MLPWLNLVKLEVFHLGTIYRRSAAIEMAPLQDETILFDPQSNRFCLLNRTAAFIWKQQATPVSSDAIGARICESFSGVALENAVRDASSTLQEMRSLNFIVEESLSGDKP